MYKYNSIVVDADGEVLVWTDGSLSGPHELKKRVKRASDLEKSVNLIYGVEDVTASLTDKKDYLAVTAALFAAAPGRTRLLEAPESVTTWFDEKSENKEGVIY